VALQGTADEVRNSDNPLIQQYVTASPDGPVRFHYPGPSVADDFGVATHQGPQP
jgi:phospholipid/cholesterol/gamma-HCH transport system ATP-binding protein